MRFVALYISLILGVKVLHNDIVSKAALDKIITLG